MNNLPPLDPVAVAIVFAATVFSPGVAAVVGPYAVIVLGATTGAAWALGRQEPLPRWRAALYFARLIGTAVLLSVGIATAIGAYFHIPEPSPMLSGIAFLIGWIGDDWPGVGRWIARIAKRLIEAWMAERKGDRQ